MRPCWLCKEGEAKSTWHGMVCNKCFRKLEKGAKPKDLLVKEKKNGTDTTTTGSI